MLCGGVLARLGLRRRRRADDRGRWQGLHRAADHDGDDGRAAEGKGFTPDRKAGMGTAAVRSALENGQVDVYWEYTGTALGVFHKITDKFATPEEAYKKIKELDAAKGIVWLNMSPVNNTYAFAMNRTTRRSAASSP